MLLGKRVRVLFIGGVVAAGLVVAPSADAGPPVVGRLGIGRTVFWDGTYVPSGHVENDSLCNTAAGPCFDYRLTLGQTGPFADCGSKNADDGSVADNNSKCGVGVTPFSV